MRLRRAFRIFSQLSWRRRALLIQSLLSLALAALVLALIPFARVAAWLGESRGETPQQAPEEQQELAKDIGWAVRAAAARVPWEAECLVQALAAAFLMRMRGLPATLYLGVAHGEGGQLQAHAWLRCGALIVTGKAGHERFRMVASFARRAV